MKKAGLKSANIKFCSLPNFSNKRTQSWILSFPVSKIHINMKRETQYDEEINFKHGKYQWKIYSLTKSKKCCLKFTVALSITILSVFHFRFKIPN